MKRKSAQELSLGLETDAFLTQLHLPTLRKAPPQKLASISFFKCLGLFMVAFVLGIVFLIFSRAKEPYWPLFGKQLLPTLAIILLHLFALLIMLSYFQTMFTEAGTVPPAWNSKIEASERLSSMYKRCRRTEVYKPPRSAYDGITGVVVLNMDHYCPWVNNCVGFFNRKFFILFVSYAFLGSGLAAILLLPYGGRVVGLDVSPFFGLEKDNRLLKAHQTKRPLHDLESAMGDLMAFVMAVTFCVTLSLFSGGHIYMAMKNVTSMQFSREHSQYDLGWRRNLEQVFGANPWLWGIPLYGKGPVGDGVHWEKKDGSWDGLEEEAWLDEEIETV